MASTMQINNENENNNNNNNNNFPADVDDDAVFPNDDEAGDEEEEFKNTIKWCDVEENVWLRVEGLVHVHTKYGPAVIAELLNRNGETIRTWTTKLIGDALKEKEKKKKEKKKTIY